MPLDDIVNVQITRQTQTVSQAGFGTLMILGTHKQFNQRIKYYSSMSEVGADFAPYMKEYIAAQDVFAQSPRPTRLAIGRRITNVETLKLQTAQSGATYTTTINGNDVVSNSTPSVQESTVNLDADFQSGNRIKVVLNGTNVGTITSIIDFNIDFVASNNIACTVNGVHLTPDVTFTSDQATTIGLVATKLGTASGVASATVTGARQITVVFASAGNNTVTSVVTTLGASQPTATISEGGFTFDTDQETTMGNIATAMAAMPNIDSVDVTGVTFRTLVVHSDPNQPGVVNSFTITLDSPPVTATIVNNTQPASYTSILQTVMADINAFTPDLGVTASINTGLQTLILTGDDPEVPFTVSSSTNITMPVRSKVTVDQAEPATEYVVTLNGVEITYTSADEVFDNETIAAGLVQAINLRGLNVTATDNLDGSFILAYVGGYTVEVSDNLSSIVGFEQLPSTASQSLTEDLDQINEIDSNWYALAYTGRVKADVLEIAAWVETQIKIYGTASNEAEIVDVAAGIDTDSIAAQLASLGYVRTFCMYHQDAADDYPECAWFGKCLPFAPGSETWKFKTLANVTYSQLTTDQQNNALNKNCNLYMRVGGVGITQNGTMAQGEFIDIIRGIDWLSARIQEFVYALLVNSPKVPYTNAGIASVEAEIRRALQLGIDNDFIATQPAYTVTVPDAATVSPANKAARLLTDVSFTATLAGAIHAVEIRGVVTV